MSLATVKSMLSRPALPEGTTSTRVKNLIGDYGILLVFAVVIIYLSFTAPNFLTTDNLINIVRQSSIIGFIAVGMTFVMITGGIDLSVGSVVGLTGVVAATLAPAGGSSFIWAIVAGIIIGVAVGFINASFVVWGSIMPFLATLAMMSVVRSAALIFTNGQPVSGLNDSFQWLGTGAFGPIPVPVVIFFIVAIIADFALSQTKFGKHVYAVGGNGESAKKVGISVKKVLVSVYLIAGTLAAVAGLVLTSRVDGADPLAGEMFELQAISAVVVGGTSLTGGRGTVRGTILGVLLIGVVLNGMNLLNVSSYYQKAVQGLILVLAVLLNRWKSD